MRQPTWWIRVVVVLTSSMISTSPLFAQQPTPYRPSIPIGGYNVFIGMSLDSLMKTLGSVYRREFADPNRWDFYIDNTTVAARVFVRNQQVVQIVKYYNANSSNDAQRVLREAALSINEFTRLKSAQPGTLGYDCGFVYEQQSETKQGFSTRCGYYGHFTDFGLFGGDDLLVLQSIRVFNEP